jgi:hypothetical protein
MSVGYHVTAAGLHQASLRAPVGTAGWIVLGDVTEDLKEWATMSDPTVRFFTGSFEFVDKQVDRRKPTLPVPGDRIRLKSRQPVFVLDYAVSGHKRVLDPPFSVDRYLENKDKTGVVLEPGSIVEVQAVEISPFYSHARIVWARVSPVSK